MKNTTDESARAQVTFTVNRASYGAPALYLDGHRVTPTKPMGSAVVAHRFTVDVDELRRALGQGDGDREACPVCRRAHAVNADGRLRKHAASGGPGVCRGSGRPTSKLLDERDRGLARLRAENEALRGELAELRELADLVSTWSELTEASP